MSSITDTGSEQVSEALVDRMRVANRVNGQFMCADVEALKVRVDDLPYDHEHKPRSVRVTSTVAGYRQTDEFTASYADGSELIL